MGAITVTAGEFAEWLRAYQSAWEGRDAAAAAKLFTDDARYHWTPLVPPQHGPAEIASAWAAAVGQQRDIRFTFDVFAVSGASGMATWRADFTRLPDQFKVRIEGVLARHEVAGTRYPAAGMANVNA